uniref:FACT complex subunit n=1 Tax=Gongylonema pulchrum TaxID=637853 RepID=A0A183ERF4_9BILA
LDLAPPTRKLMKLKETGIADKLFVNPGCPHLRAFNLLKIYRSQLVVRAHDTGAITGDDIRRDLEMVENVDDNIEPEGSIVSGFMDDRMDDFDDAGMGAVSPVDNLAHLETIPEEEIPAVPEEIQISNKEKDLFAGPEKKKERKSRAERTLEEDETAIDGEDEHRWTKRTQNVLNSISAKIKASADGKVKFFLPTENSHLCFLCVFAVQRCYSVAIVSKSAYCREVVCMCVFRSEQTLSPTFISATRKSGRLKFWICIPTRVSPPL